MKWNTLNIRDRADIIRAGVRNGLTVLSDIREAYNRFDTGGPTDNSHIYQSKYPAFTLQGLSANDYSNTYLNPILENAIYNKFQEGGVLDNTDSTDSTENTKPTDIRETFTPGTKAYEERMKRNAAEMQARREEALRKAEEYRKAHSNLKQTKPQQTNPHKGTQKIQQILDGIARGAEDMKNAAAAMAITGLQEAERKRLRTTGRLKAGLDAVLAVVPYLSKGLSSVLGSGAYQNTVLNAANSRYVPSSVTDAMATMGSPSVTNALNTTAPAGLALAGTAVDGYQLYGDIKDGERTEGVIDGFQFSTGFPEALGALNIAPRNLDTRLDILGHLGNAVGGVKAVYDMNETFKPDYQQERLNEFAKKLWLQYTQQNK